MRHKRNALPFTVKLCNAGLWNKNTILNIYYTFYFWLHLESSVVAIMNIFQNTLYVKFPKLWIKTFEIQFNAFNVFCLTSAAYRLWISFLLHLSIAYIKNCEKIGKLMFAKNVNAISGPKDKSFTTIFTGPHNKIQHCVQNDIFHQLSVASYEYTLLESD